MPRKDLEAVQSYLAAGKPLVGIRTASHAFDARGRGPKGYVDWPTFDPDVLGGHYIGHCEDGPKTTVKLAAGVENHPILAGVTVPFSGNGSLYKVRPLKQSTTPLLVGTVPRHDPEPVAWTNQYGKSRIFYTSLGHPENFRDPAFIRLLTNAVLWSLEDRR